MARAVCIERVPVRFLEGEVTAMPPRYSAFASPVAKLSAGNDS